MDVKILIGIILGLNFVIFGVILLSGVMEEEDRPEGGEEDVEKTKYYVIWLVLLVISVLVLLVVSYLLRGRQLP